MVITKVNIREITVGDTVIHHGHLKTVCRRAFSYDEFFGVKLWGDSYMLGRKPVERVTFPKWHAGKLIN